MPFIARWPGQVPAGKTSNEVIAFQDLLPTLAELAGAKPPANLDGVSMAKVLAGGETDTQREYLYWDYGHCRPRYDQAVRWQDWKGIRLGQDGAIQLYDLATDLGEKHDVAAQHPEVVERMARIMQSTPTPSDRYPIGKIYRGKPHWTPALERR